MFYLLMNLLNVGSRQTVEERKKDYNMVPTFYIVHLFGQCCLVQPGSLGVALITHLEKAEEPEIKLPTLTGS